MRSPPRPRVGDHLHVLALFFQSWLGLIPGFLWIPLSPLLKPWVRRVLRRRLEGAVPSEADEPPAPDPEAWAGRTVFVVAGEPSGDALAARVVRALHRRCPDLRVRGYAGPRTQAAGADLDRLITEHAVVGVWAVLRSFGTWWRLCAETLALWRLDEPDVLLTVDFPGLNGRLARWARKRGIRTVHLVPPAVWAYMPWRLLRWRLAVDRMLTVFPFEPPIFEGSGIPCVHVGHPGFEAPLRPPRTPPSYPDGGHVELLPGSRRQEILGHTTIVLEAAARIQERMPGVRFVVRLADAAHGALFEEAARGARARPSVLDLRVGEGEEGDEAGDAPLLGAVAASGTVTAELGAALVPHVIFYRVSPVVRLGALIGLTAPWIGLVNLIARRELAVERIMVRPDGAAVGDDFLRTVAFESDWLRTRAALEERVRRPIEVARVADRIARAVLDVG